MRPTILLVGLIAASVSAAPARAQAEAQCELHFWASDSAITSTYSGVDGAIGALLAGGRPRSPGGLQSDLPPEAQAEALRQIDLSGLLQMPNVRLIAETAPYQGKASRKGPRLTSSTAPCYAELVVDFIGYRSHITDGRKFGARLWLRRYPDGAMVAQVQNGGKDVRVKIYPAKKPENHAAGLVELQAAFGKVVEKFLRDKVQ